MVGLQEGVPGGKIGILRSFQPNIAPKRAQHGQHRPTIGQHRPNIGPTLGPTWPNIDPRWARWLNMGSTWPNISPQDGATWARLGPTWAQPALNVGPDCFHRGKHCALCLPRFNIALPGFARRLSAQSSHTIRPKSLPTWCQDCLAGARLSGVGL